MTKALFFDIDGTLVSFDTHRIPDSTHLALAEARRRGLKLFIATGRPRCIINNLGDELFDGYITMNGACCFMGQYEQMIFRHTIPSDDVRAAMQMSLEEEITTIFVSADSMYIVNPNEKIEWFSRSLNVDPPLVLSPEEILKKEIFQISPFITVDREPAFMRGMPHSEVGRWHPIFTDIVAAGTGKQRGIDEVTKYLGIRVEETMAFGDGGNDIGMLKHVGIGVAMGNAAAEVQQAADYVTDTVDNDGILKALLHFRLI
ncbi:MAG: Cof-type HAD-IIB family hydrolase [Prevotellaceae bacterium]|jgi:Cof subfamily protein (haloacid dehalogenase superfamily)|nr:Cof-type HAD-IIB family hydrolase [Prevotellaceae bacterium]